MTVEEPRAEPPRAWGWIARDAALTFACGSEMPSEELDGTTGPGRAAVGLPDDRERALYSARHAMGGECRRIR